MKQKVLLLIVLTLSLCGTTVFGQNSLSRELKTEDDGFQYYKIQSNGIVGAEDKNGKTLIPISRGYSKCFYHKGWIYVRRNGAEGVCDISGKEIIAPDKYSFVNFHPEEGHTGWFGVKIDEEEGACDMTGREIIPCKFKSIVFAANCFQHKNSAGDWIKFDITLDELGKASGSDISLSSSPSSSSSSVSSTKSSSSKTSSLSKSNISNTYHDVVAFELKGKVKRCKWTSDGVIDGYEMTFDNKGKLSSIGKYGDETIYDIKHSEKGYLTSIKSSDEMIKHREFEYSNNKLTKTKLSVTAGKVESVSIFETIFSSVVSSFLEFDRVTEFFYSNNIIVKCISITKDSEKEEKDILNYSNYKYDKHGNWISRTVKENGKSYIEKRTIEYY